MKLSEISLSFFPRPIIKKVGRPMLKRKKFPFIKLIFCFVASGFPRLLKKSDSNFNRLWFDWEHKFDGDHCCSFISLGGALWYDNKAKR